MENEKKQIDDFNRPPLFVPCACRKPNVAYFDSREIGVCRMCGYKITRHIFVKRMAELDANRSS